MKQLKVWPTFIFNAPSLPSSLANQKLSSLSNVVPPSNASLSVLHPPNARADQRLGGPSSQALFRVWNRFCVIITTCNLWPCKNCTKSQSHYILRCRRQNQQYGSIFRSVKELNSIKKYTLNHHKLSQSWTTICSIFFKSQIDEKSIIISFSLASNRVQTVRGNHQYSEFLRYTL